MMGRITRLFYFCAAMAVSVSAFGQQGGKPHPLRGNKNSLSNAGTSFSYRHQVAHQHGSQLTEMNMVQLAGPLVPGIVSLYLLTLADKKKKYMREELPDADVSSAEKDKLLRQVTALEAHIVAQEARAQWYGTEEVTEITTKNIQKLTKKLKEVNSEIDGLSSPKAKTFLVVKSVIHKVFFPWLGMLVSSES